jgi:L-arabinose isomerase
MKDFAEMNDIEIMVIDKDTDLYQFKQELKWNEVYYRFK